LKLVRGESGLTRVEYVAPPVPEVPELKEGEKAIEIAESQGHPTVNGSWSNGVTFHLHRESHDWGAAERYAAAISQWLNSSSEDTGEFLGLPPASMPTEPMWVTRAALLGVLNLHDDVSISPLVNEKPGRLGGSRIVVPGTAIPVHGVGKRRR
jgi:hypothetical protein